MIALTNADTDKTILIRKDSIVTVEDVGAYRILIYVRAKEYAKLYVKEDVEHILPLFSA